MVSDIHESSPPHNGPERRGSYSGYHYTSFRSVVSAPSEPRRSRVRSPAREVPSLRSRLPPPPLHFVSFRRLGSFRASAFSLSLARAGGSVPSVSTPAVSTTFSLDYRDQRNEIPDPDP